MTTRPRGRPPKYPPAEVRSRLIDVAIDQLHQHGVRGGLEAVNLDDAITESGVPRGAAYKMWKTGEMSPQDAYRTAVVIEVLSMPATAGLPATREFAAEALAGHADALAGADQDTRKEIMRELMRTVGEFNFRNLDDSVNWKLYSALRTAALTRPDTPVEILDVLRRGEDYLLSRYAELYQEISDVFQMRIKEPFTYTEFAAALYAVTEGLAGRLAQGYRRYGIPRTTGPGGSVQDWTLMAVAFEGLVDAFFEPA